MSARRRWLTMLAAVVLILAAVILWLVLRGQPATTEAGPDGLLVTAPGPSLPTPTTTPTATPSPTATPVPERPELPVVIPAPVTGPSYADDPAAASDLITEAATAAVLAYVHSDSREDAGARRARLEPLFAYSADALDDEPIFTAPQGVESASDGEIGYVEPAGDPTATTATVTVGVQWSLAYWRPSRTTTTYGGDLTLTVHVVYQRGAWVVDELTLIR